MKLWKANSTKQMPTWGPPVQALSVPRNTNKRENNVSEISAEKNCQPWILSPPDLLLVSKVITELIFRWIKPESLTLLTGDTKVSFPERRGKGESRTGNSNVYRDKYSRKLQANVWLQLLRKLESVPLKPVKER